MGIGTSRDLKRKIDQATSNTSLSNLRYIITERPKWKIFRKKEVSPIPAYSYPSSGRPVKGCPCGNKGLCKQKVTPKGVIIHYPQKKKIGKFAKLSPIRPPTPRIGQGLYSNNQRITPQVKLVRPRKLIPTWRLDKIMYASPVYRNIIIKKKRSR